MRALLHSITCTLALLVCSLGEGPFEDVESAYLKALYQKEKPILKTRLAELQKARVSADAKEYKAVVKEIDRDIAKLKARIKKQDKTLKALKDVEPLAAKGAPRDATTSNAPRPISAPLAKATMQGGVRYDTNLKALVGWASRHAQVAMSLPTENGVTYTVQLNYSTTEKGRIQIALGKEQFLPSLKDTGGMGKRAHLPVGRFTAEGRTSDLTISLPIHRSKPFVQIHSLRLVPR